MRVLLSAYACEPGKGSEAGAGYALLRAASAIAETWVLTRSNNVEVLEEAVRQQPPLHPIHVVGLDPSDRALAVKRRSGAVRPYYALWQRLAARQAAAISADIQADIVHHATMSAFWMPVGVGRLDYPLVVGPMSGGTTTPSALLRYLGLRGLAYDGFRLMAGRVATQIARRTWVKRAEVLIAQNKSMADFALRRLAAEPERLIIQSHAAAPDLDDHAIELAGTRERSRDVVFAGRLVDWKGPKLAIRSFAAATVGSSRLVFLGDGPDKASLQRLARREGVADRVIFLGQVPRPKALQMIRRSAALLFPSFHDSAGFVVAEALSLGVPVICLDHGGPGTLVNLWPSVPHVAVPVENARQVQADLASAIRAFVGNLEPVHARLRHATPSLVDGIQRAYTMALERSL